MRIAILSLASFFNRSNQTSVSGFVLPSAQVFLRRL